MASTRNINSKSNYCVEQNYNSNHSSYMLNGFPVPKQSKLPNRGINVGGMSRDSLAYNSIDIESSLFGINSTNLVNPQPEVVPENITLSFATFDDGHAPLIMPDPLIVEKGQRPFPRPS